MDMRSTLALVREPTSEGVSPSETACACGRRSVVQDRGTRFCCPAAELTALRELRGDLDRMLSTELEDPPSDTHVARVLGQLFKLTRQARRL